MTITPEKLRSMAERLDMDPHSVMEAQGLLRAAADKIERLNGRIDYLINGGDVIYTEEPL